jgi:hypothetical protein
VRIGVGSEVLGREVPERALTAPELEVLSELGDPFGV